MILEKERKKERNGEPVEPTNGEIDSIGQCQRKMVESDLSSTNRKRRAETLLQSGKFGKKIHAF